MNVTYPDRAKQVEGFFLLEQATACLTEVLGPSAEQVRIEWDRMEDACGRAVYTLRLSDWTGEASGNFSLEELRSSSQLRYRLVRLWGDLLQDRSHKQLKALTSGGPVEE